MPSYVVTGSSQGLGFAFLEKLARDPSNTVIGLSRTKSTLEAKLSKAGIQNVTVLEADVSDLVSLKRAAEATADITGGALDILINNAAFISEVSEFKSLLDFNDTPEILEQDFLTSFRVNTLGVIHAVTAFLPLIRRGSLKKIVNVSTGVADIDVINDVAISDAAPYAVTKAASNLVIAKYNAALKHEGILFLSISPGFVTTERNVEAAARDTSKLQEIAVKFAEYAPHFKGPLTPEESVTAVLAVIEQKSVEKGDGGAFISHLGNKQWL